MVRKGSALVVLVAVGALVAAVSASGGAERQQATTVTVMAGRPGVFAFKLSKRTAPKGVVTFKVMNMGALVHDFKIAGKKTALLKPGKSATLKVTFKKAGRFAYLCTVAGHAAAGMKGVFTVK